MRGMRRAALLSALILALAAPAASAQEGRGDDLREGLELMERGAGIILRLLMNEMEPLVRQLAELIDDLNAYHPPERLPNGDIILRRKVPLVVEPPTEGEVEL